MSAADRSAYEMLGYILQKKAAKSQVRMDPFIKPKKEASEKLSMPSSSRRMKRKSEVLAVSAQYEQIRKPNTHVIIVRIAHDYHRPKEPLPCTFSSCNSYSLPLGTEKTYAPSASNLDCRSVAIKNGQYALQSRVSKKRQSAEANIDKGQGRELASAWTEEQCEYHLNDEQRQFFTNWLRQKYFDKGRTKKCISSAKLILDGITTYGNASYTYANLREAPSSLLDIVREYVTWDDDGTLHPKKTRRSTSPTYSCPSGSGAHECHNASFSKQVCNGRQLSPTRELSFEEREAARMLQQFQQQTQPTSDPPSSQQLREVSVRNTTRECPQGTSSDMYIASEQRVTMPEQSSLLYEVPRLIQLAVPRPIVDDHMAQCTVSGQDSVPRMQDIATTPQPEDMTELVSMTNAADISNFGNSYTFFQPHDPKGEQPMTSQSHSQDMEGLQDSGVQQLMTSHVPMIDTTRYSQSMESQIIQDSGAQQLMASHVPMIDTTRYAQSMEQLMGSRIYSDNIQHSIPQNTSIHSQYIQEADGFYNQFSSFHHPV
ncbi:predicted protein [Histoplasma mississippiense (nom. inval.)]|uniref:predicted protein n=1 Tax=Ajellomyces capsulatus (strain NAm1 / WU24) TaxID=2059318 RepID=UPI000157C948|nr:predicted protein [Histoplasma mississippiense (nom. inval.)]EDN09663.1 predicted protein [Histoplasma mississippiense (nom. inval.)]